ncbi:ATP-binding protein [Salimicrobium halophilum]|uniref:Anti-sigma regulatory factor (Ser/Thr protein kinase) n=1 Tax=Salimicrobium halophilum TaxID=86666 RepID=A0A1G8T7B2_9BACI|nr:ATP-binding protein [Salimicrobium halophilum]SDJ36570.1 Anti-sigma regulatory factor (Ser/Thr protein kinase) [Salimicrobium halophilum]
MRTSQVSIEFTEDLLKVVRPFIREYLSHLSEKGIHAEVGINEALNNAFSHGNDKGTVRLTMYEQNRKLIVRLKDNGEGFEGNRTPHVPPGELDHGRGLFLMESFFERVIYNRTGNELLMMKYIRD